MNTEIDTEPDLEVKSNNVITRVWNLGNRIKLPVQFASPELCLVEFPDQSRAWKLTQLVTPERNVDLEIEELKPLTITPSFYDFDSKDRMPSLDEEAAVEEIELNAREILRYYGAYGTLV